RHGRGAADGECRGGDPADARRHGDRRRLPRRDPPQRPALSARLFHGPQGRRVRRRNLIMMLSAAALTWPLAAHAQQRAMPMIGLLSPFSRADTELWHQAFRQGLRDGGWIEGVNVRIEYRFAEARMERLPELVSDLIKLKV